MLGSGAHIQLSDQSTDGAFPGDASGRPISCEPERGDLPRADRQKSGQIIATSHDLGPQMVVKSKGNLREIQVKYCNLARLMEL